MMPNRDQSGPNGSGPMTGRALGDCRNNTEIKAEQVEYGYGIGRGRGLGRRNTRRPLGRGRRNQGR